MSDLKPCPFCSDPMVVDHGVLKHVTQTDGCPLKKMAWGHSAAIDEWNRRADLQPTPAQIMAAAVAEYQLEHASEGTDERMGRRSAVRGMMVRLGLYGDFDAALAAIKEPKT